MCFLEWLPGLLLFVSPDPVDHSIAVVAGVAADGPVGPVGPVGSLLLPFLCLFPCPVPDLKSVLPLVVLQRRKQVLLCEDLVEQAPEKDIRSQPFSTNVF